MRCACEGNKSHHRLLFYTPDKAAMSALFIECSLNDHWMFTECSLNVHWMFTECSLNAHWMFTECWLVKVTSSTTACCSTPRTRLRCPRWHFWKWATTSAPTRSCDGPNCALRSSASHGGVIHSVSPRKIARLSYRFRMLSVIRVPYMLSIIRAPWMALNVSYMALNGTECSLNGVECSLNYRILLQISTASWFTRRPPSATKGGERDVAALHKLMRWMSHEWRWMFPGWRECSLNGAECSLDDRILICR
jgi:hypothetical protein